MEKVKKTWKKKRKKRKHVARVLLQGIEIYGHYE